MERYKFVYLSGFLASIISLSCLLLWLLTQQLFVAQLSFGLSILTAMMALSGAYYAYVFYNDKTVSKNTLKTRRKHFIGHTVALSLGLALSWVNFKTFKAQSFPTASEVVTVSVNNTSDSPVQNLSFQLGSQRQVIKTLDPRKSKSFELKPIGEGTFSAELTEEGLKREASIAVGSDNQFILLRVDYQHNLLAEVQ